MEEKEREEEKEEKETNPAIRSYNVQTRRNSSLFFQICLAFFLLFLFLPALLSFLSPESKGKKSKYGRDNNNKKKRKGGNEYDGKHSRIGGFISFFLQVLCLCRGLAITCGVVLQLAQSLFSGSFFWSVR